jgi:L-alanine-DL-glutamate epimerase-like enolase superfamily enzyme
MGELGLGRIQGAPHALAALIEHELVPVVIGTDPAYVRRTYEAMLAETEYHGSLGLTMFGIAALGTTLWDCLGRSHGVPFWQLWGAARDRVPAYAMVGWLKCDDGEVQRVCCTLTRAFARSRSKRGARP